MKGTSSGSGRERPYNITSRTTMRLYKHAHVGFWRIIEEYCLLSYTCGILGESSNRAKWSEAHQELHLPPSSIKQCCLREWSNALCARVSAWLLNDDVSLRSLTSKGQTTERRPMVKEKQCITVFQLCDFWRIYKIEFKPFCCSPYATFVYSEQHAWSRGVVLLKKTYCVTSSPTDPPPPPKKWWQSTVNFKILGRAILLVIHIFSSTAYNMV